MTSYLAADLRRAPADTVRRPGTCSSRRTSSPSTCSEVLMVCLRFRQKAGSLLLATLLLSWACLSLMNFQMSFCQWKMGVADLRPFVAWFSGTVAVLAWWLFLSSNPLTPLLKNRPCYLIQLTGQQPRNHYQQAMLLMLSGIYPTPTTFFETLPHHLPPPSALVQAPQRRSQGRASARDQDPVALCR